MMEAHTQEEDFERYKPVMEVRRTVMDVSIRPETIAQVKADGEGQVLIYSKEHAVIINRSGLVRSDLPATKEVEETLKGKVESAKILCELHVWHWKLGRPGILRDLKHIVSTTETEKLRLGIFDLIKLNGEEWKWPNKPYPVRLDELNGLFAGHLYTTPCFSYILPNTQPLSNDHLKIFWDKFLEFGYEGVVVRDILGTIKVKTIADMDVAIIGLKKTKTFTQKGRVQTVRVALMDEANRFIVLGDVGGGIDHDLGDSLYKLTKFKVGEDSEIVYIQPLVVAKIEYTDLFQPALNEMREFGPSGYRVVGYTNLATMREPRLVDLRPDKKISPTEVGVNQIPPCLKFWRLSMNEFEYIKSISETLIVGKWIAVVGKDIIYGDTAKEVFTKIKEKYPDREPFIMKVPEKDVCLTLMEPKFCPKCNEPLTAVYFMDDPNSLDLLACKKCHIAYHPESLKPLGMVI